MSGTASNGLRSTVASSTARSRRRSRGGQLSPCRRRTRDVVRSESPRRPPRSRACVPTCATSSSRRQRSRLPTTTAGSAGSRSQPFARHSGDSRPDDGTRPADPRHDRSRAVGRARLRAGRGVAQVGLWRAPRARTAQRLRRPRGGRADRCTRISSRAVARADVVVSAAGQTMLEAAACGTPCIALPLVDNQREQALGSRPSAPFVSSDPPETARSSPRSTSSPETPRRGTS